MLEKIGTVGYETLSRPQYTTISNIKTLLESGVDPVIAEIGVGIGATSRGICEALNGRGKLHIFDFQKNVDELAADLNKMGHANVVAHGNTEKYWDSYHWSLMKLWQAVGTPIFDYVYLDGAHTVLHDVPAFFIADKLLKVGGTMDLDDYNWTFASSKSMKSVRDRYMTPEQEEAAQVKMVVDTFVKGNKRYETLVENRIYRKLSGD